MAEADSSTAHEAGSTIELHIVSPSVGVSQPLVFSDLTTSTTVRQLKKRIQETLTLRPSADQQRLIHRGRLLHRDEETLRDVFKATIDASGHQTLHLVLRDAPGQQASARPAPAQGPIPGAHPAPFPPPVPADDPLANLSPPGNAAEVNAAQRNGIHGQNPAGEAELHAAAAEALRASRERRFPQRHPQHVPQGQPYQQGPGFGLHPGHAAVHPGFQGQTPGLFHFNTFRMQADQIAQAQHQNLLQHEAALRQHVFNARLNAQNTSGRNSPALGATVNVNITREIIGPDGQYTRITIGEPPAAVGQLPAMPPNGHAVQPGHIGPDVMGATMRADEQTRGVDQATRTMTGAMHRSASGASLASLNVNAPVRPIPPGVTTAVFPGASRQGSRSASPAPGRPQVSGLNPFLNPTPTSSAPAGFSSTGQASEQSRPSDGAPEVYILSSPAGPHAILLADGADGYYTSPYQAQQLPYSTPSSQWPSQFDSPARQYARRHLEYARFYNEMHNHQQQPGRMRGVGTGAGIHAAPTNPPSFAAAQAQAQAVNQQAINHAQQHAQFQQAHVQPGHQPAPAAVQRRHIANAGPAPDLGIQAHPHPPNANAVAFLADAWPPIWLAIRLLAFVWWFTSSESSWSRRITVFLIALTIYLVNTGLLNGAANRLWNPIRQHLDGLLPLADLHAAPVRPQQPPAAAQAAPGNNSNSNNNPPTPGAERQAAQAPNGNPPDPAQAAARLIAQRQENNANWVMSQIRRMERAMLLFLASIAPGVAERHIARLEAEERAAQAERERVQREADEARARAEAQVTPTDGSQGQITSSPGQDQARPDMQPHVEDAQEGPLIQV